MDYLSHNVAVNLKRIRTSKGMSLDVVSEQTGVSKSMLAQIERGGANPSLGVLGKIASGLRITFQELISSPPMDSCLVKVADTIPTKELEGQYRVWTCFPFEDNRMVEIYRIEIEPGGVYVSGGHGEKTREYIAVLEGTVTIECKGEKNDVSKEEVFRFETDQTHSYRNLLEERASFMCFFLDYR
ncbi:MAG: helix-turn-helix domain-containing protein [Lachnospiraceae bacterium]